MPVLDALTPLLLLLPVPYGNPREHLPGRRSNRHRKYLRRMSPKFYHKSRHIFRYIDFHLFRRILRHASVKMMSCIRLISHRNTDCPAVKGGNIV